MKKITLILLLIIASIDSNAQSTIFEDSFESYTNFAIANVGNWTLTNVDGGTGYGIQDNSTPPIPYLFDNSGAPKSFQVFNPALTTPPLTGTGWSARTGVQSMVCFNKNAPLPLVNDDWLISPSITLGTSNTVKFWAKAGSGGYPAEKFSVYLSSTTTAITSFTKISAGNSVTLPLPGTEWVEFTYTIPASYDNAPVYVGIQCVSEDQFGFLVDDFKVTGIVPCAAPQNGTSIVNTTNLTAVLSWTSAGGFDASEIKVQLADAGTPALTNDTGVNINGLTYTANGLTANTNYEFWIRDECTTGVLFSSWSGPFKFNTNFAPNCAVLVAPANGATAVSSVGSITLSWTAATTGSLATSYDVYLDTNPAPTTLAGNVTLLSYVKPNFSALTVYYWKVVAKNLAGSAIGCTSVFSFTTGANAFSPYCGPVEFSNNLEPITNVNFAGITKTYPNTIVAPPTVHHKLFTDLATVAQGSTNAIVLKGNTGGNFTNKFIVFIDWNQNGVLNDAGEVYFDAAPLTILNSDGLDAISATGNIVVPVTATLGNTKMRIKKMFTASTVIPAGFIDPCKSLTTGQTFGEMHDYRVTVTTPLATNTFTSTNFKFSPNPVKDILNLSYDKNITSVSVMNLLGQEVLSYKIDSNEAKIDMSSINNGVYMIKVIADNEVKTIKIFKE